MTAAQPASGDEDDRRPARRRVRLIVLLLVVVAAVLLVGVVEWSATFDPQAKFLEAIQLVESGRMQDAAKIAAKLETIPEFESHGRLIWGGILLRQRQLQTALDEFGAIQPEGTLRLQALLWTGECLYHLGQLADAAQCFTLLSQDDPENAAAHRWMAAVWFDLGAMDHALASLARLTQLAPEDCAAHRLSGHILYDFEKFKEAQDHYRRALQWCDDDANRADAGAHLARCLIRLKSFTEALTLCRTLPHTPDVMAAESECLWATGDIAAAKQMLNSLEIPPGEHREAALLQARIAVQERDPATAARVLEPLIQRDPFDVEALHALAGALQQLQRSAEATEMLERSEVARKLRLRMVELNQQAIERPGDVEVRRELATVCLKLGKPQLAAVWQRAASGYSPAQSVPAQKRPSNQSERSVQESGPVRSSD